MSSPPHSRWQPHGASAHSLAAVAVAAVLWGCNREDAPRMGRLSPAPAAPVGQVTVHQPKALGGVALDRKDALGRPLTIACASCHSQRQGSLPAGAEDLDEFHAGLVVDHGDLRCGSCHDAQHTEQLRLSHGETIAADRALELCAQCHGPQFRDYRRGSHGGMTGHWDLSRGDRVRNHCVDCHDPHAPSIGRVKPALPPRDRFFARPHPKGKESK